MFAREAILLRPFLPSYLVGSTSLVLVRKLTSPFRAVREGRGSALSRSLTSECTNAPLIFAKHRQHRLPFSARSPLVTKEIAIAPNYSSAGFRWEPACSPSPGPIYIVTRGNHIYGLPVARRPMKRGFFARCRCSGRAAARPLGFRF
jgi:hypothetical protein